MTELDELEHRLTLLRSELTVMSREGCTPTQFLKLQRDLVHAWAAVEEYKSRHMPARLPAIPGDELPAKPCDAVPPEGLGSSRADPSAGASAEPAGRA
jgi:hypothetical protein